jgi:hypothetical protein
VAARASLFEAILAHNFWQAPLLLGPANKYWKEVSLWKKRVR